MATAVAKRLPCCSTSSSSLLTALVNILLCLRQASLERAPFDHQGDSFFERELKLGPPGFLSSILLRTLMEDFGFDPLGLGEDPEGLKWYVQAELIHSRFAMAGIAGILFTDLLRTTGTRKRLVWYEARATKFDFASTRALLVVQLLLMGSVETKRYMDFINLGSQAPEVSFFCIEAALEGLEPGTIGNDRHVGHICASFSDSQGPNREPRGAPLRSIPQNHNPNDI
ncbi:hypothetical protein Cgig2_020616 [Carnegiea gigantea]|uniref:Chlorophyll a-b binding protein, chloroplastic n=1 Tax=Carnegiea gigantea TaxID=171969 RepID=A0A9Q1Q967_9CARY|nr:hypothetical protein Cgig2_020616 [Carnegiea gigantea]